MPILNILRDSKYTIPNANSPKTGNVKTENAPHVNSLLNFIVYDSRRSWIWHLSARPEIVTQISFNLWFPCPSPQQPYHKLKNTT